MASWVTEYNEDVIPSSQESDYGSSQPPAKRLKSSNLNGHNNTTSTLDWKLWDGEKLAEELEIRGLGQVAKIFNEQKIIGRVLPDLTEEHLEKLGINKLGQQLQVKQFIAEITAPCKDYNNTKVFNDPIHGHIELHPLCVRLIDTPQFQRLRFLKQLGTCYFVYPGATHNRFEHSIGVCHLAGRLVRALQRRQPELEINAHDVLCVEIAGLCHDLGHGPFSHLFDGKFIPHMRPDCKWKHEEGSRLMLKHLLQENDLLPVFHQYGLNDGDIDFIEEQVAGARKHHSEKDWPYVGRPQSKSFLYEIVANKRNGIDVDKWDYFARDCHMLGIKNNFDHNRCIQFARVINVEGKYQICSRDKEVGNLYDMFHTRNTLHRRAYQHQVTNIIDSMITEAMVKANDYIFLEGTDGKQLKMSDSIDDMVAYCKLTDYIFFQILHSSEPELKESRDILTNLMKRKLYKFVSQTQLNSSQVIKKDEVETVKREIIQKMKQQELELSPLDIVIHLVYLDYGMKEKNPIDSVRFYSKDNPDQAIRVRKDQVSQMLPETFSEQQIRVYYKKRDSQTLEAIRQAFIDWCREKNFPSPKGGDLIELTPIKRSEVTPEKQLTNGIDTKQSPESAGKGRSRLSFD